jgi:hypothetical protein
MVQELKEKIADVGTLCRKYQVEELHLFGSATTATSLSDVGDLDFLVRFKSVPPGAYAVNYFGLVEGLSAMFAVPVDLVEEAAISNPFFKTAVEEKKERLYRAA